MRRRVVDLFAASTIVLTVTTLLRYYSQRELRMEGPPTESALQHSEIAPLRPEVNTLTGGATSVVPHHIDSVPTSENQSLIFQKRQLDEFCKLYDMNTNKQLPLLNRHLLVDTRSKAMYCFVPKSGCTHLKIVFLANQGILPSEEVENYIESGIARAGFGNLDRRQKLYAIRKYFKFVLIRNPLERLYSAYRDKIIRLSLSTLKHDEPQFNYFRKSIFKYNHPVEYEKWAQVVKTHGSSEVSLKLRTFGDFINYWSAEPPKNIHHNEHFQPVLTLCQPCLVRYDYYGNFKTFSDDAKVLINKIHAPEDLLLDGYYSNNSGKAATTDIYRSYYKELSLVQKKAVLRILSTELDFYYHLFPDELDCHKEIMDIKDHIVRPYAHANP